MPVINGIDRSDPNYVTYYSSCKTNLCNSGDGKPGNDNGNGGIDGPIHGPNGDGTGNYVVPGVGAAITATAQIILIVSSLLLLIHIK